MNSMRRDTLLQMASVALGSGWGTLSEAANEPPPETTRIRVAGGTILCFAAQFVAEELLRGEGFDHVDPHKDVQWREDAWPTVPQLLADARIDAYLGFPPEPQELRNRKIGHVSFSTRDDRPWSQYFCCMVAANREFVRRNPAATKRALRAIVKGMEICAADPERAARAAAAHKPQARLDDVVQMVKDLRYGNWREFSAEDTARFFALRLRDIGMVKGSPQKLLAQGSDWRFIDQLRKEMRT
jgi:NitT/TauT family transport system substrate-binding protein